MTNTVFNPASALDFMTAFVPAIGWVSPYTYQALLGSPVGGPAPGGTSPCFDRNATVMTMFLGLTITRERKVSVRPSFSYPARLQGTTECETQFSAEFLDRDREVLDCAPLRCSCTGSDCHCWPKVLRTAIRVPPGARWMVVWEKEQKLHEEEIPDPPAVKVTGTEPEEKGLLLRWRSDPAEGLWYLVQWLDRRAGVFRGVAPRTQERSLLIPRSLFTEGTELTVRFLATARLSTGMAEAVVDLPNHVPPQPSLDIQQTSSILRAVATDAAGREVSGARVSWYDGQGAEVMGGSEIDLRTLPLGRHVVRAVVRGLGSRTIAKSWLVERTREGIVVHHPICDPEPRVIQEEHRHPHAPPPPCAE